jgi:CubicO group peptidase (beta-lactamase class C family)
MMDRHQIPGAAVGILYGEQAWSTGFGITNTEHPLPVTDATFFQIGSITKTFVSTAIMRLVERGDVALDATIRTYIPNFAVADEAAAEEATVRHLLTHTGGWAGDFFHDAGPGADALARYVADMADLPQLAPLGSHWSYNNAGFTVAGRIVEVVTGQPFEVALAELVLRPLGLKQPTLDPGEVMTHRFAVGHWRGDNGPLVARPWALSRATGPMGGLICHVQDLLRYARFHLGSGLALDGSQERLLALESLAQMQSPQVTVWGQESWGLSWRLSDVEGTLEVSHGGGTKGQISLLAFVPAHNLALVVLTNADSGGKLTEGLRRWVLRELVGLDDPEPEQIEASEKDLAKYTGRYQGFFSDWELGLLNGKLVGQAVNKRGFPTEAEPPPPDPPPVTLGLCEPDRLLALDGPHKGDRAEVIRRQDGSIGWLRISGRLHVKEK